MGYVVSGSNIREGEILTTRVKTPVLFSEDLSKLDDETYWKITYNETHREYKIQPDSFFRINTIALDASSISLADDASTVTGPSLPASWKVTFGYD